MNTESQTDRITQLESERAAMREALESVVGHANRRQLIATEGTEDPELHRLDEPDFVLLCKQALSTDAGKSLLEKYRYHLTDNQRLKAELERVCDRLQAVEAERDRYRAVAEEVLLNLHSTGHGKGGTSLPDCQMCFLARKLEALQPAQKEQ